MAEDLTLEQSIKILLDKVPTPVQDFVLNDLSAATQTLMDKHFLHVDQGGVLQNELMLMLLGQENPAGFATALKEAGISEPAIQSILTDVNENVFKKLRTAQQEGKPEAGKIEMLPSAPAPVVQTPVPSFQTPPPAAPFVPPAPQPAPVAAPTPIQATTSEHSVRTMQSDMDLLKSGGFQTQKPVASAWEAPVKAPEPEVVSRPTPPPAPIAPPLTKEYGVDPYREPVQ